MLLPLQFLTDEKEGRGSVDGVVERNAGHADY